MKALCRYWRTSLKPSLMDMAWLFRMAFILVGVFAVSAWLWFAILTGISDYMGRYL